MASYLTSGGGRSGEPFAAVGEPCVDSLLSDSLSVPLRAARHCAVVHGDLCIVAHSGQLQPLLTRGELVLQTQWNEACPQLELGCSSISTTQVCSNLIS